MTAEELIELTPVQLKAWRKIKRGVKEFEQAGGKFYVCLSTMSAYNGEYVQEILPGQDGDCGADDSGMPYIYNPGFCSYADDRAGVLFTDKGKALLEGDE
ncbi:hypothetical protein [Serratia liquefaciens]|uniref:hypothetical protein n=1 Tax=Serratia liquefaciens TaxID=614 RepID=UPI003D084CFC